MGRTTKNNKQCLPTKTPAFLTAFAIQSQSCTYSSSRHLQERFCCTASHGHSKPGAGSHFQCRIYSIAIHETDVHNTARHYGISTTCLKTLKTKRSPAAFPNVFSQRYAYTPIALSSTRFWQSHTDLSPSNNVLENWCWSIHLQLWDVLDRFNETRSTTHLLPAENSTLAFCRV